MSQEQIDWLKNVGKVVVFELYGLTDAEERSLKFVYQQTLAARITGVIITKMKDGSAYPQILITPIKPLGEDVLEEIGAIDIREDGIAVEMRIDRKPSLVHGRILEVY